MHRQASRKAFSYPTAVKWVMASMTGGCLAQQPWRERGHAPNDSSGSPMMMTTTQAEAATSSSFQDRVARPPMVYPTSPTNKLSPTLPIRIIRPNPNLEIAFDVRTRNAIYAIEKLDRQGHNLGKDHKRPNFFEEKTIDQEAYRSKLSHYKNSGFDRGHLAPAADFPLQTLDTYNLCNISPQNHTMNLSIWSQIEEFCRRVADRRSDCETYVVTGPAWLPIKQVATAKFQYAYVGLGQPPSLVAVPTHFFKVIAVVSPKTNTIVEFACFVVPNTEPNKSKGMQDYVVPWTDLEAVTGLQFFPTLATEEWKAWADTITLDSVLRFRNSQGHLLLTDGTSSKPRKSKAMANANANALVHLCKGGECR